SMAAGHPAWPVRGQAFGRIEHTSSVLDRSTVLTLREAHPHGVEAAVDVEDLAGDPGGEVGAKECGGVADVLLGDVTPERRYLRHSIQHLPEPRDPRGCERLDRAGRDPVDAYSLRAEIGSQKADIGLQTRLGKAHDVVAGDGADRAEIREGEQGARTVRHQRRSAACESQKAVAGNVVGDAEG